MLRPIKNNVILELIEKEKVTASGIILKSADPAEVSKGVILAIGPEVDLVKEGEIVLLNWNKAKKVKYEDSDLFIATQDEIILVFDPEEEESTPFYERTW